MGNKLHEILFPSKVNRRHLRHGKCESGITHTPKVPLLLVFLLALILSLRCGRSQPRCLTKGGGGGKGGGSFVGRRYGVKRSMTVPGERVREQIPRPALVTASLYYLLLGYI